MQSLSIPLLFFLLLVCLPLSPLSAQTTPLYHFADGISEIQITRATPHISKRFPAKAQIIVKGFNSKLNQSYEFLLYFSEKVNVTDFTVQAVSGGVIQVLMYCPVSEYHDYIDLFKKPKNTLSLAYRKNANGYENLEVSTHQ